MRLGRIARCGVVASAAMSAVVVPVLAQASSPGRGGAAEPVLITVDTGVPSGGGGGGGGGDGGAAGDRGCTPWVPNNAPFTAENSPYQHNDPNAPGPEGENARLVAEALDASPTGEAQVISRHCNGEYEWMIIAVGAETITVDDLWPGAYDEARDRIPLPELRVAPGVVQGTLVNAPLWLAVAPPAPVSARAEVGAVWAQVHATFVGLTWDMGVPGTDDDIVECDGPGEEWSEPGPNEDPWQVPPCGWNYDQPSTAEHTGNGENWYDITVTGHWTVRLTGSDGRDVALDPIDMPNGFDYVVWELQTVGSG